MLALGERSMTLSTASWKQQGALGSEVGMGKSRVVLGSP